MIAFDNFLLNKVAFEVCYEKGYRYWDKAGDTICKIEEGLSEWKWKEISTDKTVLANATRNMESTFSWNKFNIKQDLVDNLSKFKDNSNNLSEIILKNIEVKKLTRIGNRYWFVFPCESVEEAESIIAKGNVFNSEKSKIFGKRLLSRDYTLMIEDEDKIRYRVAVSAVKRKKDPLLDGNKNFLKFNPHMAIMVDIDVVKIDSMLAQEVAVSDFIQKSYKKIENNMVKFFK